MTVPTRLIVNKEEMVIEAHPEMTVLVAQQGIRIDCPDHMEINSRDTLKTMSEMNQRQWEHISTGPLFTHFFRLLFPSEDGDVPIPATIEDLNSGDYGVIHASGLIVMMCEAIFAGTKKIFLRTPEDHLHPKATRSLVTMIDAINAMSGGSGGTVTATDQPQDTPDDQPA